MKPFYSSKLFILLAICLGFYTGINAQTVTNYSYTGAGQTYTVPAGCTLISFDVIGGKGGGSNYGNGGAAGRVQGMMTVTPGQVLNVYVGNVGAGVGGPGGGNGAGYFGGIGSSYGGAGGGCSEIQIAGTRVIVAGGGGGGSWDCTTDHGGLGGGTVGGNGLVCGAYSSANCGTGGSQTAGGIGGSCGPASNGSFGNGGNGFGSPNWFSGGGAGYYGGGGGACYGSGGGGSSYPAAVGGNITALTHTQGYNNVGNGSIGIQAIIPTIVATPSTLSYGSIVTGASSVLSFSLSGLALTTSPLTLSIPPGFALSTVSAAGPWLTGSTTVPVTPPTLAPTTIWVQFNPTAYSFYSNTISITGGGTFTPTLVNVNGTGVYPCSGTPTPGTVSISPTTGNSSTAFTLSVAGASFGPGISYQWMSSAYPTFGFVNIGGATNPTFTFTGISTTTYYICVVTCAGSGLSSSAASVSATFTPSTGCTGSYSSGGLSCTSYNMTTRIAINGEAGTSINDNAVPCNGSGYLDETALSVTLQAGLIYPMTMYTGPTYGHYAQVWIDFNSNGIYETSESVGGQSVSFTTSSVFNITIPGIGTITPGAYRMHVVGIYNGDGANYPTINPCTPYPYGENRDYTVVIQGPPCAGTPIPGTISADVTSACANFTSNIVYTTTAISSGLLTNWEMSTTSSSTGYSPITAAVFSYISVPVATSTVWVRERVRCFNSGLSAATAPVQLVINPLPAPIGGTTNVCMPSAGTLTSASAGGTWSVSNPSIANINPTTGIITGLVPGAVTATYTLPTGCKVMTVVGVNNGAAAINGLPSVCVGSNSTLFDVTPGGNWSSSNTSAATVGLTTGIVTGVNAGLTNIVYTLPNSCSATIPIVVNPVPAAITGSSNVCLGSTRILSSASAGGTWSSSNGFVASVGATSGIVNGIAIGSPTIRYTLSTGCTATLPITVSPLPLPISGGSMVCVGQATTLSDATSGGTWGSSDPSTATVNASTGDVTGVAGGSPIISYFAPLTGCYVTQAVTVNNPPAINNVTETNGGGYCPGSTGVHIGLDGSTSGVTYYLWDVTAGAIIDSMEGSSSGLDFGLYSTVGSYTVNALNALTGCMNNMAGSANVYVFTPPAAVNVIGGGHYCSGGVGVEIGTDGSESGVNYQLYHGSTAIGAPVSGNGGPISFGYYTAIGHYYAVATSITTLCTTNLGGGADVYISANPLVFNVGGGGPYCAGSTCPSINLDGSTGGVNYQIYIDGVLSGSPYSGVSGVLDLGPQCIPGHYTLKATDITNGCSSNMNGSADIRVNPLPTIYTVTGGGAYCAGGVGVHIGTNFSVDGTDYTLVGTSGAVSTVAGSNSGLDFGVISTPDVYTVNATIRATGCSINMTGSVPVVMNSVPTPQVLSAGAAYCAGSGGVDVNISASESAINYQLYRDGLSVGSAVHGSTLGLAIDFGRQVVPGTYTVSGINPVTGCTSNMIGSSVISVNALPTVYTITGGGNYCAGGIGVPVNVTNSTAGVTYEILIGSVPSGLTSSSVGGVLSLGLQTTPGVYTVKATDPITNCSVIMDGSLNIAINPLPAPYTVTGGGNYCQGTTGRLVGLALSNTGISYQLMNGSVNDGSPLLGSGSALNFGIKSTPGSYSVVASNLSTGCVNNMSNIVPVTMINLPTVFTVTGGGAFCAGDPGATVNLSGSDTSGVTYTLYRGSTAVGSAVPGTGSSLTFGPQTVSGSYTAIGTTTIGGCTSNMSASVNVVANAVPGVYNITGGGNFCQGGTGVHVFLSGSNTYVNYDITSTGSGHIATAAGTGRPLDFGAIGDTGTISVIATDVVTGCHSTMTGSALINTIPTVVPSVTIAGSSTVCEGSRTTYTAVPVNGGSSPVYQWTVGGSVVGYGNTYSYVPSNSDIVAVRLTGNATCASLPTVTGQMTIAVSNNVTPSVMVDASTSTSICPGTSVTFSANPVNGGSTPVYEWRLNGTITGGNTPSLTITPTDGTVVFCTMASSIACITTSAPVISNNVAMTVNNPKLPIFDVTADPGTTIADGQALTLSAKVSNLPATAVTYQWKLNGTNIAGATNSSYMNVNFNNNDVVCCAITSHNACGNSPVVSECQTIIVHANTAVNAVGSGNANISVSPNPNTGIFNIKGSLGTTVDQEVTLEVTNMLGQVVYSNKVNTVGGMINEKVQLSNSIANGMYLLNVRAGAENSVIHFVIEQ